MVSAGKNYEVGFKSDGAYVEEMAAATGKKRFREGLGIVVHDVWLTSVT